MKVRSRIACISAAVAAVLWGGGSGAQARNLSYDIEPDTVGVQDGSGNWDAGLNWVDAGTNVTWLNSPADSALFGNDTNTYVGAIAPNNVDLNVPIAVQDITLGVGSNGGSYNLSSFGPSMTLSGNITKTSSGGALQVLFQLGSQIELTAGSHVFALRDTGGDLAEMTVNGPIAGAGGVTLDNGAYEAWGTLVLNADNTYAGATSISRGRLVITTSGGLGATSAGTTISGTGRLAIGGAGSTVVGAVNIAEPITITRNTYGGGGSETGSAALIFNNNGPAQIHTLSGPLVVDSTDARIEVNSNILDIPTNITEGPTVTPGTGVLTLGGDFGGQVNLTGNNTGIGVGGIRLIGGVQLNVSDHLQLGGATAPLKFEGSATLHPIGGFMTNFGSHPINNASFSGGINVDAGQQFTIDGTVPLGRPLNDDTNPVGSIGKRGDGTLNLSGSVAVPGAINLRGGQTFWDSGVVNVTNSTVQLHSLHLRSPVVNIGTNGVVSTHVGFSALGQDSTGTDGGPDKAVVNITGNGQLLALNGSDFNVSDNANTEGTINLSDNGVLTVGGLAHVAKNAGGKGTINQTGGTFNLTRTGNFTLVLGSRNGLGTYNLAAGTMNSAGEFYVGQGGSGVGVFNMSGGTVNQNNWFVIGREGGQGTVDLSGGIFNKTGGGDTEVDVGAGVGPSSITIRNSAEYRAQNGNFAVGVGGGGNGTLTLQDSAKLTVSTGEFWVGQAGATGVANIQGSAELTVVNNWLALGRASGASVGTLNLSGDAKVTKQGNGFLAVGSGGQGTFNQTGGTLTSNGTYVGEASNGTMNLSGGTATFSGEFKLGQNGGVFGTLNVSNTANVTVPAVIFGNNGGTGGGTLNLDGGTLTATSFAAGAGTGNKIFNFNGGLLRASGGGTFIQGLTAVNIQNGGAVIDSNGFDVTIAQPLSAPGTGGLTKNGTGTLTLTGANVYSGATTVNAGTLRLVPGTASLIKSGPVTVAGKIDLTDNKLITSSPVGTFAAGAYTGVSGLVDSGRGNASNAQWDGLGIVTTDTRAVNNNDLVSIGTAKIGTIKGVADGATTTFAGQTVLGSDTVAMVTWGGDANLDGKINIDDYGQIDFNVASSGSVFGWYNGDFNYDGKINIDDYGIIDFNVSAQNAIFPTAGGAAGAGLDGVAAVPEPASLSLLAMGAVGLLSRRRRNRGGQTAALN